MASSAALGAQLRRARKRRRLTLRVAGARIGMSAQQLVTVERGGHMPRVETIQRLAKALGVDVVISSSGVKVKDTTRRAA